MVRMKMATAWKAVAAVALMTVVAGQVTCAEDTACASQVGVGSANRVCYDLLVASVCTMVKDNLEVNFIFKANEGYQITSGSAGVARDCASIPNTAVRYQRSSTVAALDELTLAVPLDEITSEDGCCGRIFCFVFEAEVQEAGAPGTSGVYTASVGGRCSENVNGLVVCERVIKCEGCDGTEEEPPLCTDSKLGPITDSGCESALPFCDSGDGTNDGDSAPGDTCRLCSGRGPLKRVDWNCPEELPDCITSSGAVAVWEQLGDECVCLLTGNDCGPEEQVDPTTCLCAVITSCDIVESDCAEAEIFDAESCVCECPLTEADCLDPLELVDCACICPLTEADCLDPLELVDCACICLLTEADCEGPLELVDCACNCPLTDEDCAVTEKLNLETCACEEDNGCDVVEIDCEAPKIFSETECLCFCPLEEQMNCAAPATFNEDTCTCESGDGCILSQSDCEGEEIVDTDLCECVCKPELVSCEAPLFFNEENCTCGECLLSQSDCIDPTQFSEEICGCVCPIAEQYACETPSALNEETCECECQLSCPGQAVRIDSVCECFCPPQIEEDCESPFEFSLEECACKCDLEHLNCVGEQVVSEQTCTCECPIKEEDCAEVGQFDGDACECRCAITDDDCELWQVVNLSTCECECDVTRESHCGRLQEFESSICGCYCPTGAAEAAQCSDGLEFSQNICDCCGFTFVQVGQDVPGEHEGDRFGFYVSMSDDGSRFASSSSRNTDGGYQAGHVRVFELNAGSWTQLGSDIDGIQNELLTWSVNISGDGNRVVIGYVPSGRPRKGSIIVYEYNSGSDEWLKVGSTIVHETTSGTSSSWVAITPDGNTLAFSMMRFDTDEFRDAGAVDVWEYDGEDWSRKGSRVVGQSEGELFGFPVRISEDGSRIVVGAYLNGEIVEYGGAARVFEYTNDEWTQVGETIYGEFELGYAGQFVTMNADGSRIGVGIPGGGDCDCDAEGIARIFEDQGGSWVQIGGDIEGVEPFIETGYGLELSADGNRVAVLSKIGDGSDGTERVGVLQVFDFEDGAWIQVGQTVEGRAAGDQLEAIDISRDCTRVVVTSVFSDLNGSDSGAVRVFDLTEVSCER